MKANRKKYTAYVREITTQYKTLNTETIHTSSPSAVAAFLRSKIGDSNKEQFVILCVNNKNIIVAYHVVSVGTVTESIVHPREVFSPAVLSGASGIICAHNHPSGNHTPSRQDVEVTKKLSEAGKILGIPILDHIIVGYNNNDFYSLKENGYMG